MLFDGFTGDPVPFLIELEFVHYVDCNGKGYLSCAAVIHLKTLNMDHIGRLCLCSEDGYQNPVFFRLDVMETDYTHNL